MSFEAKDCQRYALKLFRQISDEIEGPLVVTVAVTKNELPGIGKTSVGLAASWDITTEEKKKVFTWILECASTKEL